MNIGIVYNAHGKSELLSYALGKSLEQDPVSANIQCFDANPLAFTEGKRFIDENITLSYEHADPDSPVYERRQAAAVLGWCAVNDFDLVVDWHTTPYEGCDIAALNPSTDKRIRNVCPFLGLRNTVFFDNGIVASRTDTVAIDVWEGNGHDSQVRVEEWRRMIYELATDYNTLDDFDADYDRCETAAPQYWQYGNVLTVDRHTARRYMTRNPFAAHNFKRIDPFHAQTLGAPSGISGSLIYGFNTGNAFLDQGILGEYIMPIDPASPNFNDVYARNRASADGHDWGRLGRTAPE